MVRRWKEKQEKEEASGAPAKKLWLAKTKKGNFKRGPAAGRGRAGAEFENAVRDELIVTEASHADKGADGNAAEEKACFVRVVANITYTYEMVRMAVLRVREFARFKSDPKVQAATAKVSRKWFGGWLRRMGLAKRRVTAAMGKSPPKADIDAWNLEFQADMTDPKFAGHPERLGAADETAVTMEPPKYQYVPGDSSRGAAPGPDTKRRITAMVSAVASGILMPLFLIVKCSAKGLDLTGTKILGAMLKAKSLHGNADDWVQMIWEREIPLKLKGAKKHATVKVKRPYLYNSATHAVVTIQKKAWMDTIGMCMHVDLILKPYMDKVGGFLYMVWVRPTPAHAHAPWRTCRSWAAQEGTPRSPPPPPHAGQLWPAQGARGARAAGEVQDPREDPRAQLDRRRAGP